MNTSLKSSAYKEDKQVLIHRYDPPQATKATEEKTIVSPIVDPAVTGEKTPVE